MPNAQPVAPADRIDALDALRGTALVGILAANLLVFGGVTGLDATARAAMPFAKIDAAVRWLQVILVEGKFYGLFSLLFGIGAGILLARVGRDNPGQLFRRRMLGLVVIGVLHSLVWRGDILLLYALLGLLLPAVGDWSDVRLLRVGIGLFAAAIAWQYLMLLLMPALGLPVAWPFALVWNSVESYYPAMDAAVANGDLFAMLRFNLMSIWGERWPTLLATGRPFKVLGFFLIGMWVMRRGIPGAIGDHRALLTRVARWGALVGLPANLLFASCRFLGRENVLGAFTPLAEAIGILSLTLGYAAWFALLWSSGHSRSLRLLQPLGRVALTAYLMQSVLCLYGLSGLGLGWYLRLGATAATGLVVPVIALQLVLARWWLARFEFGPVEWIWRSLTYGAGQRMRAGGRSRTAG